MDIDKLKSAIAVRTASLRAELDKITPLEMEMARLEKIASNLGEHDGHGGFIALVDMGYCAGLIDAAPATAAAPEKPARKPMLRQDQPGSKAWKEGEFDWGSSGNNAQNRYSTETVQARGWQLGWEYGKAKTGGPVCKDSLHADIGPNTPALRLHVPADADPLYATTADEMARRAEG